MTLISQPGSDYQITSISLDAGYTRDLILMLIDVHAVLDHLYLDGTPAQITSPGEDYLRESASPYTLPALIDALGEVTDQLSRAERQALGQHPARPARMQTNRQQSCRQLLTRPSPAQRVGPDEKGELRAPHTTRWGQIKEEQWGQIRLTKPQSGAHSVIQ